MTNPSHTKDIITCERAVIV